VFANKGAVHVRAHVEYEKRKKAVGVETSWSTVTSFFYTRKEISW
jgi:uncharacterized DUF497 family protein